MKRTGRPGPKGAGTSMKRMSTTSTGTTSIMTAGTSPGSPAWTPARKRIRSCTRTYHFHCHAPEQLDRIQVRGVRASARRRGDRGAVVTPTLQRAMGSASRRNGRRALALTPGVALAVRSSRAKMEAAGGMKGQAWRDRRRYGRGWRDGGTAAGRYCAQGVRQTMPDTAVVKGAATPGPTGAKETARGRRRRIDKDAHGRAGDRGSRPRPVRLESRRTRRPRHRALRGRGGGNGCSSKGRAAAARARCSVLLGGVTIPREGRDPDPSGTAPLVDAGATARPLPRRPRRLHLPDVQPRALPLDDRQRHPAVPLLAAAAGTRRIAGGKAGGGGAAPARPPRSSTGRSCSRARSPTSASGSSSVWPPRGRSSAPRSSSSPTSRPPPSTKARASASSTCCPRNAARQAHRCCSRATTRGSAPGSTAGCRSRS